jgi:hypothetical protein
LLPAPIHPTLVDVRGALVLALIAGCSFRLPSEPGADPPSTDGSPAADVPAGDPPPFALTGPRWLLPCTGATGDPALCDCPGSASSQTLQVGGAPGEHWHVTARIRGVMEVMTYAGGAIDGTWYAGGAPSDNRWNLYRLTISSPAQVYFLNPGGALVSYSEAFDYMQTFDVDAGATVTFDLDGQDSLQWRGNDQNGVAITMTGVTEPVQPYDGQFARIDVITAVAF